MSSPLMIAGLALALASPPTIAQVQVTDAWVRGTVPGQRATGAFMQLASPGDSALVAVSSPAAKAAEIHTMTLEGGVMRMRAIDSLALPAGKTVELKPGGYHVMLLDLAQPLKEGDSVPVVLTFADATGRKTSQEVKATVRALTAIHKH
jgi:periplasmic copper chaperone A